MEQVKNDYKEFLKTKEALFQTKGEHRKLLQSLYEKINFDSIQFEQTLEMIGPAIFRIINSIKENDYNIKYLEKQEVKEKAYKQINVDKIIYELDMLDDSIHLVKKHLKNIDVEAELLSLYCKSYIKGLINDQQIEDVINNRS